MLKPAFLHAHQPPIRAIATTDGWAMVTSSFNNNIIPRSTFNIQNSFSLPFFIYICNMKPTTLLTHLQTTPR